MLGVEFCLAWIGFVWARVTISLATVPSTSRRAMAGSLCADDIRGELVVLLLGLLVLLEFADVLALLVLKLSYDPFWVCGINCCWVGGGVELMVNSPRSKLAMSSWSRSIKAAWHATQILIGLSNPSLGCGFFVATKHLESIISPHNLQWCYK